MKKSGLEKEVEIFQNMTLKKKPDDQLTENFIYKLYSKLNKIISKKIDVVLGFSKFVLNTHRQFGFFSKTKRERISPFMPTINKKHGIKRVENVFDFDRSLPDLSCIHIVIVRWKLMRTPDNSCARI